MAHETPWDVQAEESAFPLPIDEDSPTGGLRYQSTRKIYPKRLALRDFTDADRVIG
jgi:hypothetical protein